MQPALAAPSSTSATTARDDSTERSSRQGNGRVALSEESAADSAKAAAAKKKASDKKLAGKKAEARKTAVREKQASEKRAAAKRRAALVIPTQEQLRVSGKRYTRVALNVRRQPASSAGLVTVLSAGSKVSVTNTTKGSWRLVIHQGKGRWVHSGYLTKSKPTPAPAKRRSASRGGGLSMARCSSGSGMESGLTNDAIRVHRAICKAYPSITSYGGRRSAGDSFHTSGRAVDVMISSSSTRQAVANWVRANRMALGVSEIIYSRRIWTVQRGSEGWRSMSDRGGVTANHEDHVHVSVYGSRGTG